ncbi:MAG: SGNH/GDSL hydrolase family protein, partial [Myxococcota bacterium]
PRRTTAREQAERAFRTRSGRGRESSPARRELAIVAEGDSWFDYPFFGDTLNILEDHHNYRVESAAQHGDRIEDMAYREQQIDGFSSKLERVKEDGRELAAILLSGGGNDIVGPTLGFMLEHAKSRSQGLNEDVLAGLVEVRLRLAFEALIAKIDRATELYFGRSAPIIVHGYGYAVPDGRGFLGGAWILPGPWLEPQFRARGYDPSDLEKNGEVVRQMIDSFNAMLEKLDASIPNVHYVDVRDELPSGDNYRDFWQDELHPTDRGFRAVAAKIDQKIVELRND